LVLCFSCCFSSHIICKAISN